MIRFTLPLLVPRARSLSKLIRPLSPWIGAAGVLTLVLGWASDSGRGSPPTNAQSPTTPGLTETGVVGDSINVGDVSANGIYASMGDETDAGVVILHDGRILGEHFLRDASTASSYIGTYEVRGAELSGEVRETEFQRKQDIERRFTYVESDSIAEDRTLKHRRLSGTLVEHESLQLTFNRADGEDIQVAFRYDDVYERTPSIAQWEGIWEAIDENGVSSAALTVDADGSFFGQDLDGCTATGNLTVINPDRNLYGVELTIGVCGNLDGDYSGFAVYRDSFPGGIETDRALLLASTAEGRGFWSGRYSRAGDVPEPMPSPSEDDSGDAPVSVVRFDAPSGSIARPWEGAADGPGTGVISPGSPHVSNGGGPFGNLDRPVGVGPASDDGSADSGDAASDRAALVALYHATDGPNWIDSENWLTDAPLGEWYGVDTDSSGRVVRLESCRLLGLRGEA